MAETSLLRRFSTVGGGVQRPLPLFTDYLSMMQQLFRLDVHLE